MSGMQGTILNSEGNPEVPSQFWQRTSSQCRWRKVPRRYILAIMCSLAFLIRGWIVANITMIFYHLFMLEEEERILHLPSISNFTLKELDEILYFYHWANLVAQIPSALLAISFSPHTVMAISMFMSFILQVITPWTLKTSSIAVSANFIIQGICACPLDCACMGLWREWAPSTEKTHLLLISFGGRYIYIQLVFPLCVYLSENVGPTSLYYFAGMAALVWCFFWCSLISDSPTSDPLISAPELQYLDDKVPPQSKEKIPIRSIPVKSILISPRVLALCFVFVSTAFSARSMPYFLIIQVELIMEDYAIEWMQWTLVLNCIFIVPAIGYLVDVLLNKKIIQTTTMRKVLCSGGLVLHAIAMLLFMIPDPVSGAIFFMISYIIFPIISAGVLPNILDLSPRYACVIMGLAMTMYSVSSLLYDVILEHMLFNGTHREWILNFIPVELLALLSALVFAIFGSGVEQMWSSSPPTTPTTRNDAQYYPQTNTEDEMLVTGSL